MKQFRATPFWQVWDPEALDRYVECGLCEDPNGGVKLKMSGMLVSGSLRVCRMSVLTVYCDDFRKRSFSRKQSGRTKPGSSVHKWMYAFR